MIFDQIRKSMKPMMWAVVIAFAISVPLMYGRSSLRRRGGEDTLAEVNGVPITYTSFVQNYQPVYESYYRSSEGRMSPETEQFLKYQVLTQLVTYEVLWQEAEKAGIRISEKDTISQIERIMEAYPSRDDFIRALEFRKISYPEFKKNITRQLVVQELLQRVRDATTLTTEELRDYWAIQNEEVELEYVLIKPEDYREEVDLTQEDTLEYYQMHAEDYRIPERVKVSYMQVKTEDYEDEVVISGAAVEDYYEDNLSTYRIPETRRASHILIESTPDATEEEKNNARKQIEKIQLELQAGTDFAALAGVYSEDSTTAMEGGDLGFFEYREMVPSFGAAVFALKEGGELTGIIETPFGYHLAKLLEIRPPSTTPLDEVREEIEKTLTRQEADALSKEEIRKLRNELEQGRITPEEYGRRYPERLGITPLFGADETLEEIGWAPEFGKAAFSLEKDKLSQVVGTSRGYYLLRLEEKRSSYVPDLTEAEEKVKEDIIQERTRELAEQKAHSIKSQAEEGKDLPSLAERENLEHKYLDYFSRNGLLEEIYGQDREKFVSLAFSLSIDGIGAPLPLAGGYYLIRVTGRNLSWENFSQQDEKLKQDLLTQKTAASLEKWMTNLREKAKIVDNSSLLFTS